MYGIWYVAIAFGLGIIAMVIVAIFYTKTYDEQAICGLVIALLIVGFVMSVCIAISNPKEAEAETTQFIETKNLIESENVSDDEKNNILVILMAKEANDWLAQAKADKEKLGFMSKYYNIDLDSLDYIKIE